jgi:hypothetical protein
MPYQIDRAFVFFENDKAIPAAVSLRGCSKLKAYPNDQAE